MADQPPSDRRSGADGDRTLTNVDPVGEAGTGRRSTAEPTFRVGQQVAGRYRVEAFLARGGMGEVYRVFDLELGESVALKTILPRSTGDRLSIDRFRREIQVARKVSHPNVCRIFDLGRHVEPDGRDIVFLTMELLEGESLRDRLKNGPLPPDEARAVIEQLCAGLGAAHARGIVHRDLKPSNIFLVPDGDGTRVVIADFGLARAETKEDGQLTVTGTGEILGTPAYMSPEQIEGKPATIASDVYSLGLVMYELLTGAQPFEGDSAFQIALNKLRESPTSPSTRVRGLPLLWDQTILRCLEKDPADRFDDVTRIPAVLSGEARLGWRPLRLLRRRRGPAAAVAVTALIVVGAAAVWLWRWMAADIGPVGEIELRRSVAVLGFENVTGDATADWVATALGLFVTTELGADGEVRAVPNESVVKARRELAIEHVTTLAPETLDRLHVRLATDLVVLGSVSVLGAGDETTVRLDARVQQTAGGDPVILPPITGSPGDLGEIARRAATEIRRRFDIATTAASAGGYPSDPEAARLYAQGVERLRGYDPRSAKQLLQRAAEADPGSPLVWLELAAAWQQLGFGENAVEAAARARQLSGALDQDLRLRIEGQYQHLMGDYEGAVETYRSLWLLHPDSLEYGLRLASNLIEAGRATEALGTIAQLRELPKPLSDDPRIDLAEADAAGELGDARREVEAAERVVAASLDLGSTSLEADGRLRLGAGLRALGELDRSIEELETARGRYAAIGNRSGEAGAVYGVALAHLTAGRIDEAERRALEALEIARAVGSRVNEGDALNLLGSIGLHRGDMTAALDAFSAALELQAATGNRRGEADALNNLALVQMWTGRLVESVDSFTQARARYRELDNPLKEATVVMNLARIDAARGDLDGARRLFEEASGLFRLHEATEPLAEALFGLGEVLLMQGDLQGARARHSEALEIRGDRRLGTAAESRFALAGVTLAEASLGKRSYHDAVDELTEVIEDLEKSERSAAVADALNYLAEAQIGAGELGAASASLDRISKLDDHANPVTRMVLEINRARIAVRQNRLTDAVAMLERVIDEAQVSSSHGVELEARLALAEAAAAAGDRQRALRLLEQLRRSAAARGWQLAAAKATHGIEALEAGE